MPRSKKARTELIRVLPQMDLEALDRLIQKRVAEAQASQGAILEPWFQTGAVAAEIRRHESILPQAEVCALLREMGLSGLRHQRAAPLKSRDVSALFW